MNAEGKPAVLPTSQPPLALSSALSLGAVLPDQDQRAAGSTSKDSEGPGGPPQACHLAHRHGNPGRLSITVHRSQGTERPAQSNR